MSIPATWHPVLLLPPAERPVEANIFALPVSLFIDLYGPRLRQLEEEAEVYQEELDDHMLRTALSAYEMLCDRKGPSKFFETLEEETDWSFYKDLVGFYDLETPRLRELIESRHYGKVSEAELNRFTQLEAWLNLAVSNQVEAIIGKQQKASSWANANEDMYAQGVWQFICNHADESNMRQTAAFFEWAATA